MSHTDLNAHALKTLTNIRDDVAINMLNLLRFREQANYQDGTVSTGRDAYAVYSQLAAPFFIKVGGTIVWRGVPIATMVGPKDEAWQSGFIAQYPSKSAFIFMVSSDAYKSILHHRTAAVEDSRLLAFEAVRN